VTPQPHSQAQEVCEQGLETRLIDPPKEGAAFSLHILLDYQLNLLTLEYTCTMPTIGDYFALHCIRAPENTP